MQRLSSLSPQDWEEWQSNPVTQAVRDALQMMLERQQRQAERDYWAGRQWPEAERLSLVRLSAWHEDFFMSSFEEMKTAIEAKNEPKRD